MSDELELMLLAVKNYAKSEYDTLNDEDVRTLKGIRDWVKTEMEDNDRFKRELPEINSFKWNQELGFYNCITILDKILK